MEAEGAGAGAAASAEQFGQPVSQTDQANVQHDGAVQPDTSTAPLATEADPAAAAPAPVDPQLEQYNSLLEKVTKKPDDFSTWTSLISTAEKLGDLEKIRHVYDGFLGEYPLCYGYWKKYADAEAKYSTPEHVVTVFERGVAAIPYSVDLWGHYCLYTQNNGGTQEQIRSLYERGLAYVGADYAAHGLWDKLLQYEASQRELHNVAEVHSRILGIPIKELDRYWTGLKEFASKHPTADFVSEPERAELEAQVTQQKAEAHASWLATPKPAPAAGNATEAAPNANGHAMDAAGDTATAMDHDAAPGEAADPSQSVSNGAAPAADASAAPDAEPVLTVTDDDIKAAWLKSREEVYQGAAEELARRKEFEDAIKRPYFHVKPLDNVQLTTWGRYLDYIEEKGDYGTILRLYERCLVACASYPEFWTRYVRYLEAADVEGARVACERAMSVHCKRHPDMFLFAAQFQERLGEIEAAGATLEYVHTQLASGLMGALVQRANFLRRHGEEAAARALYEEAIEEQASKPESKTYIFLNIQYASFLQRACGDAPAARLVYANALRKSPAALPLWEGAILLEEGIAGADVVERVLELYERVAAPAEEGQPALSDKEREELSLRSVDFADQRGDAEAVKRASDLHAKRFKLPLHITESVSRKRPADSSTTESAASKQQKQASEAAATAATPAAVAASYSAAVSPGAAAAAAAYPGYAAAAPAASAAYGYAQAPAYGAYGSYYQYPGYTYPAY